MFSLTDRDIVALLDHHRLGPLTGWQPIVCDGINPAYVVNDTMVLRLNVRDPDIPKFSKEAAVYRRLHAETTLSVPAVIALDVSRSIVPYDVLILERLRGVSALQMWPQLDTSTQQRLSYALGQWLAGIHTVSYTAYGGYNPSLDDLGAATDWQMYLFDKVAETLVELWHCEGLPSVLLNGAEDYLWHTPIVQLPPPVLVHGDFGLHNVLIELRQDGWQISGVLDFEWALAADAEYEFATGLLVEPDEVNPLAEAFVSGYRSQCPLPEGWEQRTAVYRLIYHLTLCRVVCQHYDGNPAMLRYHRGMLVDILKES